MELTNKKILVTGGAGFIGSHLVDALAVANQVTVVDNLSSGELNNILPHLQGESVRFVQADVTDLNRMKKLASGHDVCFHLAVQGLRLSLYDPYLVHEVNATGTLNMCQAALESGVKRFVYVSSSEVYGTAKTVPMSEDHPMIPTTPYGASKLAGEAYARSYYLTFGLPVVIVRPFNTYGPREHLQGAYGEVIPRFVLRVMNDQSPVIFGDGDQTRDFTEVSDTVRGIVLAGSADNAVGQTVNVASGTEVSIDRVARLILGLLGRNGENAPIHMAPRPGDVRRHCADTTRAAALFGFEPRVSIEEGVRRYIAWVQDQKWDLRQLQKEEVIINWRP